MKTVLILRGVSGSGKSTFASMLESLDPKLVDVFTADDFFTDENGNYNFDAKLLGHAHRACQERFEHSLEHGTAQLLIVANTNTKPSDFAYYVNAAKGRAIVTSVVLENRHGSDDVHSVPKAVKANQKISLLNTIQL
jgi:predicted kinase